MGTVKKLHDAGMALYDAGAWKLDEDQVPLAIQIQLWEEFRDALGLAEGHATGRNVGYVPDPTPISNKELKKALEGMIEIAELAMPDSYLETDSRVALARSLLKRLKTK